MLDSRADPPSASNFSFRGISRRGPQIHAIKSHGVGGSVHSLDQSSSLPDRRDRALLASLFTTIPVHFVHRRTSD